MCPAGRLWKGSSAPICLFYLKYCCEGLFTTCTSGNTKGFRRPDTKNTTLFDWRQRIHSLPGQLERLVDKRAWRWDFFMKAARFKGLFLLLAKNLLSKLTTASCKSHACSITPLKLQLCSLKQDGGFILLVSEGVKTGIGQ
ncbi:unnamed protein product [Durusdinium trenchii]|uniref:Uncharacterized protein n=2 Tax=Durusdinium trenchii TaxID=1381693 RepID=A0ABP0HDT3_9DINO